MSIVVIKRCILLVGKTGEGKSTIANQLVGHDPLSDRMPPFAVSRNVLCSVTRDNSHKVFEFMKDGVKFDLTVIDTVGLWNEIDSSNDVVVNKIEEYLKDNIRKVNVVLFVYRKGRFTDEQAYMFSLLRSRFRTEEISPISALAVTGCECDTPEQRQELIRGFKTDPKTLEIAGQMEKGIFPVGFPPLTIIPPVIQPAYKEGMERDRETLLDLVIQANRTVLTSKLFKEEVLPKEKSGQCTIQ